MTESQLFHYIAFDIEAHKESGRIPAYTKFYEKLGDGLQVVCGDVDEEFTYFHTYSPLAFSQIIPCDCVLIDGTKRPVYLYRIEGV